MGSAMSSTLESTMRKQQEMMADNGRMQMERQIQMQNIMRERMIAMQISRQRDLLLFTGPTGGFLAAVCLGGLASGRRGAIVPIVPITAALLYQYDLAYGSKMKRLIEGADNLLLSNPELFVMPGGPVTIHDIDERRAEVKDDQRFRPNQVFL